MTEFRFKVKDALGIHARPAGMLVKEANKYESEISINFGDKTADAKSIFSVMGLGAKHGDELIFLIDGKDEYEAFKQITEFLSDNL